MPTVLDSRLALFTVLKLTIQTEVGLDCQFKHSKEPTLLDSPLHLVVIKSTGPSWRG